MLGNIFSDQEKEKSQQAATATAEGNSGNQDEIPVPEILNLESFSEIAKRYDSIKEGLTDRVYLNFATCKRMQVSGLNAMVKFSEKTKDDGKHVYIANMRNDVFKALKISGKQDYFRFPHHGDYVEDK